MNIETDYKSFALELSCPVGRMAWDKAMQQEWPDSWRMPTRGELVNLFDEATSSGHKFSDTSIVWSASSYALVPTYAWPVYFHNGSSYANGKTNTGVVRLVREVLTANEKVVKELKNAKD